MCGGSSANAWRKSCSNSCRVWPGSAYMMSRLKVSNAWAASCTAARAWARSCTRPRAARCRSAKLCTPTDKRVTPAARKARKRSFSKLPGLASSVISQAGTSGRRAGGAPIHWSIAGGGGGGADQGVEGGGGKRAGGPPADEDAAHHAAPDQRQRRLQVGHQRRQVALLGQWFGGASGVARAQGMRVEVAVRAFAQAP